MENGEVRIPVKFSLLGSDINVEFNPDRLDDMAAYGATHYAENKVMLSHIYKGKPVSKDHLCHTYWHEVVHQILDKMGETELNNNEKFVDLLGGMIYQVLKTSVYDTSRENTTTTRVNKRANKRS